MRLARARAAPQHWAHERGCHLWALKQAALAGRALRGKRGHNIPNGGTGRDWVPPLHGFCDPQLSSLFCSALLCSARFARARTATLEWAHERGCHLWAPNQAALAGRALRGKRGHSIHNGGTGRDWSAPCLVFVTLNLVHSSAQHCCARRAWRARTRLLSSGLTSAAAISGRLSTPPRRAGRHVASAGHNIPYGGTGRDWSPPCLVFVTLNLVHSSAQHCCAQRALRTRMRLLSTGLTSAAAISGRSNRPHWRAERCVASAGIILPMGGLVGTGPPPAWFL